MTDTNDSPQALAAGQPLRPLVLRLIASPWVALLWLLLIFVHETIGSAFYPLRQAFELNEMQWFNGPVSAGLWFGLCLSLVTASLTRVPWAWSRFGTHLTHLSVLLLVIASTIYFGYKVEGEALILRHTIAFTGHQGQRVLLLPNPGFSRPFGESTLSVQTVDPRLTITGRDGKPQQAWSVTASLRDPDGKVFLVSLVENRPDLTRYTAQGRIPTSYLPEIVGVAVIGDTVSLRDAQGTVLLSCKTEIGAHADAGDLSLDITGITPDWPLLAEGHQGQKGTLVAFRIRTPTGEEDGSTIVGLPALTRFQQARFLRAPDPRLASATLATAPITQAYHQDRFALWLRPVAEGRAAQPFTALPLIHLPRYHDHGRHVGGPPLSVAAGTVGNTTFSITGFAPYAVPTTSIREDPTAALDPFLAVQFDDGQGDPADRQLRPAADLTELEASPVCWFRTKTQAECDAIAADLNRRFPLGPVPQSRDTVIVRLAFVSRPDGTVELFAGEPGRGVQRHPLSVGSVLPLLLAEQTVQVRLTGVYERPRQELLPVPVPAERRQSRMSVGLSQSWLEVEARTAETVVRTWIPYSPYPELPQDIGQRETVLGGYAPRPSYLEVPGAGHFELLYSRVTFALPGPLWMTGFAVPRRPGVDDPMEFYCDVAYGDTQQPNRATVHMNNPLEWNGTFFFQAGWDPQTEALSVLGVGNRPGGWFLLLASVLLGVGMIWSGAAAAMRRGQ